MCGACRDICPVKIDIPRILLHQRWKEGRGQGAAESARRGLDDAPLVKFPRKIQATRRAVRRFARLARHPWQMRLLTRAAAVAARPFSRDGYLRWMPGAFRNWTRSRDFRAPRSRR
jgi:L-lactate dehydrogenase complex protein LldF